MQAQVPRLLQWRQPVVARRASGPGDLGGPGEPIHPGDPGDPGDPATSTPRCSRRPLSQRADGQPCGIPQIERPPGTRAWWRCSTRGWRSGRLTAEDPGQLRTSIASCLDQPFPGDAGHAVLCAPDFAQPQQGKGG
ncbi:hypothetical protein Cadr_000002452 [Camelus dromedarius]|uniref:Uncharacterized protein n=1 Tax=Camelus dromedarius TaxID=9838 RepID=A0A5N4C3C6_CAMDR|nr:hypothetical protein Cadr_000002452 [Camelus dromedarius]